MQDNKEVQGIEKSGEKTKSQKPLNSRQERFALEYVRLGNARQAAINANYKEDTAKEQGYKLLQDPRIRSLIDTEKSKIHKGLLKDRSVFLSEVEDLKQLCKENKRIGELIKLLTLEASVLGIDKRDVSVQTTNIFNTMDTAKAFLNGFKDTNEDKAHEGSTQAEIVEPNVTSCNTEHTTHVGGKDNTPTTEEVYSTMSSDVVNLAPITGAGE